MALGQRGPGGGRQLGRGLSPGAAGAGPRVGSASAPYEQSGRGAPGAGLGVGGGGQGALTGGRVGAGWPDPERDRGGPGSAPGARWRRGGGGGRGVHGGAREPR